MPNGLKRAKTDGVLVFEAARCYSYQCADRFQSAGGRFAAPLGRHHPHQSENRFRRADFLTASPSREKPLAEVFTFYNRTACVGYGTRLLPPGRHPRGASLAPSGQFTFSCHSSALRNRGMTDVGHRRRRQQNHFPTRTPDGEFAPLCFPATLIQINSYHKKPTKGGNIHAL